MSLCIIFGEQKNYREPRLLVITDPRADHQAIREASYVNIPVIALCNSDTPLRYVDIAIPTNNKSIHAIGLAWWFLAREVLRLRGTISREVPWEVMVDLYFYRDPEEVSFLLSCHAIDDTDECVFTDCFKKHMKFINAQGINFFFMCEWRSQWWL